jgi:hypothetical protein
VIRRPLVCRCRTLVARLTGAVSPARHVFAGEPAILFLSGTSTTKEDSMTDRKQLDKRPMKNTEAKGTAARLRRVRRLARGFRFP